MQRYDRIAACIAGGLLLASCFAVVALVMILGVGN
jgi:hypothetical protein